MTTMPRSGEETLELAKASESSIDDKIAQMAHRKMSDVVVIAEGKRAGIGFPTCNKQNASLYLVCRLFTDAVFNQDIRAIQLIINRVDGGLPKDTEVDVFKTEFGDCLNEVMNMESGNQLKVMPEDTVMMALCKSLYSLAVQDIYWDENNQRKRKPTDADKKERDSALRMVLERAGGRKTTSTVTKEIETVEEADWIKSLPN